MEKLDSNAWKVLADLLKLAGDEFSNHGCNDYELPNTPENRELVSSMHRWNSTNPDEQDIFYSEDGTKIYTQDAFLMGFFEHLAKELAGVE